MPSGIALFGGTFDPIHHGHLIVARAVAEQLDYERVVFIPAPNPPHKMGNNLSDAAHRMEMVKLAIRGESCFEVSDVELRRAGPSYTILTVQEYRRKIGPSMPLAWIVGGDSLAELHTWYRVDELVQQCRIVTAVRPGYETPDLTALRQRLGDKRVELLVSDILTTPRIDISSTDIRRRVREGRSVHFLLPEVVVEYLKTRRLYE